MTYLAHFIHVFGTDLQGALATKAEGLNIAFDGLLTQLHGRIILIIVLVFAKLDHFLDYRHFSDIFVAAVASVFAFAGRVFSKNSVHRLAGRQPHHFCVIFGLCWVVGCGIEGVSDGILKLECGVQVLIFN